MNRTRVLVVDQAVGLWGAQRCLLKLAAPLADVGIELVLASPSTLDLATAWRAAGLEQIDLPLPVLRSVRGAEGAGGLQAGALLREARTTAEMKRQIARAAVDASCSVIHANGHAVHLEAALGARLAKLPAVLHLHEEMPQRFGRAVRSSAVALATVSIAVSQAVAHAVPRVLRKKVTVIRNGVDIAAITPGPAAPQLRSELGANADDVLLVALTRLDPEKRIEDLIEALVPLRDQRDWHLAIVGATSSYADYAETVRARAEVELPGRVTFAGRREDIAQVLRCADVLVHAGVIEGLPLGVLEAHAAAVPVVAYRVAGVPEAVIHGGTGLLAAPYDTAELGRHIAKLVTGSDLRRKFGAAGRWHVERSYTIQRQADQYAALIDGLVNRHDGARHNGARHDGARHDGARATAPA